MALNKFTQEKFFYYHFIGTMPFETCDISFNDIFSVAVNLK
jgi:hypothetical protein